MCEGVSGCVDSAHVHRRMQINIVTVNDACMYI